MSNLVRFSSGVLRDYYRITLTKERADTVDALFTLAAHSLRRYEQATSFGAKKTACYHLSTYRRAFEQMLREVYRFGNFDRAIDPLSEGTDQRESWNPLLIPHNPVGADIFDEMDADPRFPLGQRHPNEAFLNDDNQWEAA